MSGKENRLYIPGRNSKISIHNCVHSDHEKLLPARKSTARPVARSRSSTRAGTLRKKNIV